MIRYIDVIGHEPKEVVREIEESSYHIEEGIVEVMQGSDRILIPLHRLVWIK